MPKLNDLTNKRFGKLVALQRTKSSRHGYYWLCQCDCGNQKEVLGSNLISKNTQSCGCQKKKNTSQRGNQKNLFVKKDISNQQFSHWLVLGPTQLQNSSGNYYWRCRCSCGTEKNVLAGSLLSGKSKSCGCIKSHGEEKIATILINANQDFQREYIFDDCLTENGYPCRFDFALFDKNKLQCLIEYDGKQHFEKSPFDLEKNQKRDDIKNQYCLLHNIPLYRIPYTELKNIEQFLDIVNPQYLLSSPID